MQWVWENLSFKDTPFQVAHFEAPSEEREEVPEELTENLDRCEVELGACLWHETNATILRYLERPKWYGGSPGCFSGRRVLELGAGAGLCGIALALDGADSTVSDLEGLLPLLQLNVAHNGFCPSSGSACGQPGRSSNEGGSEDEQKSAGAVKGARGNKEKAKKGKRRCRKGGDDSDEDFPGNGDREAESPSATVAEPGEKKLSAKERRNAREAARKSKKEQNSGVGTSPAAQEDLANNDLAQPTAAEGEEPVATASGSCRAVAVDWLQEAKSPTLPAKHFDLIIVCDCLYENKASWASLRAVIDYSLSASAKVLLASAAQRRPFLRAFIQECKDAGLLQRLNSEEEPHDRSESPEIALLTRA